MTPSVRATWAARTVAEYRSAAVAGQMVHWCLQLGISADLVEGLLDLVRDELDHAERSRAVHDAAGGRPDEVRIDRVALAFTVPGDTLERRATYAAFAEYALHESFALEAFREMRAAPLVPVVADTLTRIVRDEARHRRLGWRLLAAVLDTTGEIGWLRGRAATVVASFDPLYTSDRALTRDEAAWGLLGAEGHGRARSRARVRVIVPRMRRLGLG